MGMVLCWTVPDYRMDNAPSSCVDVYRMVFSFYSNEIFRIKKRRGKISGLLALDTLRLTGSG